MLSLKNKCVIIIKIKKSIQSFLERVATLIITRYFTSNKLMAIGDQLERAYGNRSSRRWDIQRCIW